MREIKFRAWDGKKMRGQSKNDFFSIRHDGLLSMSNRDDCVLMQYTGLSDKHGKPIYEGDIIKSKNWRFGIYVIEWCSGSFIIKCQNVNERIGGNLTRECFEVIGNIYENPELVSDHEE